MSEELQSKIDDLLGKLPSGFSAEIIDINEQSEISAKPQREPGPALPDWLAKLMLDGANEVMVAIERGEVSGSAVISALDDSDEAAEAMEALLDRIATRRCYHYILDSAGKPMLCRNDDEIERFEEREGYILARKSYVFRGKTFTAVTCLVVHNPTINDEPPSPHWLTALYVAETGECPMHRFSSSAHEAMKMHRDVCRGVRWNILRLQYLSCQRCPSRHFPRTAHPHRPSPIRRAKAAKRIAAGQDVLRRKPTKESADRWFQRMLYEAFGDMSGPEIAQELGLPPLHRKRGLQ